MSTPEYYAQKILLNHNITSLPIETEVLIKIINSYGYGVKCIENYKADLKIVLKELNIYGKLKDAQGYALNINNMKAVFYSTSVSKQQQTEIIAHELAHIVLNHISENGIVGYSKNPAMLDLQEIEANAFARELLAPACVIKLKRYNSEEIKNNTLVSEENANIQYTQAHKRRKYTNTEKQLVKRFKGRYFKCVAALIAAVISIVVLSMSALSTRLSVSNKIIVQNQPLQIEIPSTLTQPQINFPNNENVYKAKTGRSYHNNTECRYIAGKNNVMTLTVEEAKNIGLTPCSVCY